MRLMPWGHASRRRWRGPANRRNLPFELEWADRRRFVRSDSQDHAARLARKTKQAGGRRCPGVLAELQQISGGKNGDAKAGGIFERDPVRRNETGCKVRARF